MYEHIDVTEEPGIVTITLNRPDKLNAFVGHMRRDLAEALETAPIIGKALKDLPQLEGVRVGAIVRGGKVLIPDGETRIQVTGRRYSPPMPASPASAHERRRQAAAEKS